MSKIRNYQENTAFNKSNISAAPRTPRRPKENTFYSQEINSLNQEPKESNKKSIISNMKNNLKTNKKEPTEANQDIPIKKTTKDILSSLLRNTRGKSLVNIASIYNYIYIYQMNIQNNKFE